MKGGPHQGTPRDRTRKGLAGQGFEGKMGPEKSEEVMVRGGAGVQKDRRPEMKIIFPL